MHKLLFGYKNDELVHISEVARGLECGCMCPSCGHPLIARKGNKKIHHFAHYNRAECKNAVETAMHIAAKNILEKNMRLVIHSVKLL